MWRAEAKLGSFASKGCGHPRVHHRRGGSRGSFRTRGRGHPSKGRAPQADPPTPTATPRRLAPVSTSGKRERLATAVEPENESRWIRTSLRGWWGWHQTASLETKGRARTGLQREAARGQATGGGWRTTGRRAWGRRLLTQRAEAGASKVWHARANRGSTAGGVKACKRAGLEPVTCPSPVHRDVDSARRTGRRGAPRRAEQTCAKRSVECAYERGGVT